jgi:hypothetical protein
MAVRCSLVVLTALSLGAAAWGCDCDPPRSAKAGLEGSAAVFSGKVLNIRKVNKYQFGVTFAVARQWKGAARKEIVVRTSINGESCGYEFKPDADYLVYAIYHEEAKYFTTSICSRTAALADAKADLKELGEGKTP